MSSKFGQRPVGTDGNDFRHRQRVANHYRDSAVNKSRLKCILAAHVLLLVIVFLRVSEDILDQFNLDWGPLERLNLPTPHLWEYWWLLSFVPIILAFRSMPKNNSKMMEQSYYGFFLLALLPVACGAGYYLPTLAKYVREPVSILKLESFMGFPMVVLEYAFFAIAFQVHIFAMYFASQLIKAWQPAAAADKNRETRKMTEAEALVSRKND